MSGELAKALVSAQAEMPAVEPDKVNPHFKSGFVSLDHLIAKTRPVLNKHGLAISQSPSHIEGQPALTTTIHHLSGESVSSTMPLLVGKNDMQGLGGALTYARRYAWAAALGICADEDDDGEQAAEIATRARQNEPAPRTNGSPPRADRLQVSTVEVLIGELNEANILGEPAVRDGMKQAYGTEITAELSKAQAEELITRLAAKKQAVPA